jgi:insulysin
MFQLEKSLSNPNHPYCHFGTGNLETLEVDPKSKGKDIRQELLKFHDSYYSANIMKLCILGRGKKKKKKIYNTFVIFPLINNLFRIS